MKKPTHSCFLLIILLIRMVPSLSSTVNYTDTTLEPLVTENSVIRQKIIDSQFKCYERMNRAPPYKENGLFCNRTWDGWLCWDDTPAGRVTAQNCPDYFPDFDPTDGLHPLLHGNRWPRLVHHIPAHLLGHLLLLQEPQLPEDNSAQELVLLLCAQLRLHHCTPHRRRAQPGAGEKGSWFPLVPASIHAVARARYFNDNCWMSVDTHLLYIVHGPVMAALLVNFFFLLNIVRVLVTKLRDTHRAESNMYMKAVRATLILVPLLGIQFVIIPWRPENRLAGEIYDYIMHILMHYQGLLVATIFCFFNGEVQAALKRQWAQYKAQWGQRRREHCSTRSTSYTATSISELPVYLSHHDSNSEQLNGRYPEDSELVALKSGETSA
ncbi:calcitonin receptor isoform X4 [Pogoniulus pusillus]|uniref:calcitonin receptor isoform X4 n=1 Tax=Pogoniulus pusillus TaxID=488313 RepID=UPI0030B9A2FC